MSRTLLLLSAAVLAVAFVASSAANAATWLVVANTTLANGDLSHENDDVIVQGATLTVNGAHTFNSLTIERSGLNLAGVVTHGAAFTGGDVNGTWLTITQGLSIQGANGVFIGSRIDLDAKGYGAAAGPGAGASTVNAEAGGAGYGGAGTNGQNGGAGGGCYGSVAQPIEFGSGGGNASGSANTGGAGGGAIRLTVGGSLTVDGIISANGAKGGTPNYRSGGGAGGSIWIECGTLSGAGTIRAIGGDGGSSGASNFGGGGGAGRIAIYSGADSFSGAIQACGGKNISIYGGAGTALRQSGRSLGTIYVDNCGNAAEGTEFLGANTLDANVVVSGGAALSHAHGDAGTHVTVTGDLTVQTSGFIAVDARGYGAAAGPGAGVNTVNAEAGGAGHGGAGTNGQSGGGAGGGCYGSVFGPIDFGSGGGNASSAANTGGAGGGAIRLTVGGALTVDGVISANGAKGASPNYRSGGGAGGSIWIECGSLAGAGTIRANGGDGGSSGASNLGGGGGAGRIAIYSGADSFSGAIQACGGKNISIDGGAGTALRQSGTSIGTIYVDNCGNVAEGTEFVGANTFDANLVVSGAGSVSHAHGDLGTHLTFNGNVTVLDGGFIAVDARGYAASAGPGSGVNTINADAGGAGYGGAGTLGLENGGAGGGCYGSVMEPVDFGSGGGNASGTVNTGGTGGGAIRLTVGGTLTVDGVISSNGAKGGTPSYRSGGGAGGSLWIECGAFAGAGTIRANGGDGGGGTFYGGGGGAGRIAIYSDADVFSGAIQACGGKNAVIYGGAGTALRQSGTSLGTIYVDNCDNNAEGTEFVGENTFDASLVVSGAGRVSHAHGDVGTHLTFNGDVTVLDGGFIAVDARGYGAAAGPAPGANTINADAGGGGYGGAGTYGLSGGGAGGGCYGSVVEPVDFGSGGGNASGSTNTGGAGGGAIKLTVLGTLTVDGVISSDGAKGGAPNYRSGGGAGGSVWIECGALAGAGTIRANGGDGGSGGATIYGGGGGAGRVAIYRGGAGAFSGAIQACGGKNTAIYGGAGTSFLKPVGSRGTIVVDNCDFLGVMTEFSGTQIFDANLLVRSQGIVGHPKNQSGLALTFLGDVTVNAGGFMSPNGRGYPAASGFGAGDSTINADAAGGGYGGEGGNGTGGALGGETYGSIAHPLDLGSGGGNASGSTNSGGAGGGAIRLTVGGTLKVDGVLSSNGLKGGAPNYRSGGGAGGSVLVRATSVSGSGQIIARGGDGGSGGATVFGGGGGGGRVAVYTCDFNMNPDAVSAPGGIGGANGANNGKPGTAYVFSDTIAVSENPESLVVAPGGTANFSVAASGDGQLFYHWRHDGEFLVDGLGVSGALTANLVLTNVQCAEDSGIYDVVVVDACGFVISEAAALSIPVFADLNFDCKVNSADLGILLGAWGECPQGGLCTADLNLDGFVGAGDLGILLGSWAN